MELPLHSSQKASVALQLNRLQPWSHETVNLNSICVDLDPAIRLINFNYAFFPAICTALVEIISLLAAIPENQVTHCAGSHLFVLSLYIVCADTYKLLSDSGSF